MTTNLFFTPALPQKLPSSFQCDKAHSVSPDPFSKTRSPDGARDPEHESFLTTLRKVSRDQSRFERSRESVSSAADRSENTTRRPVDKKGCGDAPACDDILNDIRPLIDNDQATPNDETRLADDLNQLIALLEELGMKVPSGEGMSLSGAEGAVENMSNPADKALDNLAALKQLLGTIQANDRNPVNDMATGLERLRQLIAQAMEGRNSVPRPGGSTDGLNPNQFLGPGQANAISMNGAMAGEGTGGDKPVEIRPALSQVSAGVDSVSKEQGSARSGENSQIPLQSERVEKTGTLKPNPDMRSGAEANAATNDIKGEEKVPGEAGNPNRNGDISRLLASVDRGPRSGGEAPMENSQAADSSPVSKLINDALVEKENPLKGDMAPVDDAGSKVVKLEATANDGGQLTSQGQTFDKTLDPASAPKETEAAQRELRTQTMEQIVRRAVIQVRDGQHEARIDLKPDFMGHVRMQVITENQQVTVKILTEFGFVKDMIENSIQQLKADLQQQGLEVDKVDVSVSRDAQGNKNQQENTGHAKNLQREDKSGDHGNGQEGKQERPNRSRLRAEGLATVDYFA